MPMQTGRSGLMAKLGNRLTQAAEVHRHEEFDPGNMDLPPGIENGIAQLADVHFGQYKEGNNKGEYFFYAAGVVKTPTEHDGIPIEGLRTAQPPIPVCDTPQSRGKYKTLADHIGRIQQVLKGLGCDPETLTGDQLESTVAALNAMCQEGRGPHFRFRTWKGPATAEFPNPRVNHQWGGTVDFREAPGSNGQATTDNTAQPAARTAPTAARTGASPGGTGTRGPTQTRPTPAKAPPKQPEPEQEPETFDETNDLPGLQEKAEADDGAAQQELTDMAVAAGWTAAEVKGANSWAEVVEMIGNPRQAEGEADADGEMVDEGDAEAEAETDEEQVEEPEAKPLGKGDMVWYRLVTVDPKTKKQTRAKNPTQCEVVSVNSAAGTATLKNLDTNKLITGADKKAKAIPFDELIVE